MRRQADDWKQFLRQFRQQFNTTGAVAPSGPFLARAITRPLFELSGPRRILEIGPGTGAFTRRIVKNLRPGDRLDLVEINDGFASHLEQRFTSDHDYVPVADRCQIHNLPLQDFVAPDGIDQYDIVISGLPLNNFSPALVTELIDTALSHVRPGGTFSMFEYMYVRPLRSRVGPKKDRERMKAIESIMRERFDKYRFNTDWVFPNVLPAWVQHMRVEDIGLVEIPDPQDPHSSTENGRSGSAPPVEDDGNGHPFSESTTAL